MESKSHFEWVHRWFPEVSREAFVAVDSVGSLLNVLRSIPPEKAAVKRRAMLSYRRKFVFSGHVRSPPAATDTMAASMCTSKRPTSPQPEWGRG